MKKTRIIALLLLLTMLLGTFASCGGGGDVVIDGGDRVGDSWEGVDFKGQKVNLCISINEYNEATFPAADIYTKGPDKANSNEVAKAVLARNKKAETELGIEIVYSTKNLTIGEILDDIRGIVTTGSKNSPDIYNNDVSGLAYAMVDGLLWNVKDPGDDVKNYFDFTKNGWYQEYIKGCTFNQDKYYIFAGDYFIDMIRMAWVVYVNHDIFTSNLNSMPAWASTLDSFYDYVGIGDWDMDKMIDIVGRVHSDSGDLGVTERSDTVVGLATNNVMSMVYPSASGITLYYLDKENGYRPSVITDSGSFQRLAQKYVQLMASKGVYQSEWSAAGLRDNTIHFAEGNVLFITQRLGEMESGVLRDFNAAKGLVPLPKWNKNEQKDYHTVVHNQAELGAILNTAKAYSAASALMQFLNEESKDVVHAYYEKGLKYKYNDDKNARAMMDLVRECTDDPFSLTIGNRCEDLYMGGGKLAGLQLHKSDTVASTFASEKDSYIDCMNRMIEKFNQFD